MVPVALIYASALHTAASLNLKDQTLSGSFRSGSGTAPGGTPAAQWSLDELVFQAIDQNGISRVQQGNLTANGISTAGWKFRANDATGAPVFDSDGLISAMQVIGSDQSQSWSPSTLNGVGGSSGITGSGGEVSLTSISFSLARTATVLLQGTVAAAAWTASGIVPLAAPIYIRVAGQANSASTGVAHSPTAGSTTAPTGGTPLQVLSLPAGSYTAAMYWNSVAGTTDRLDLYAVNLFAFRLGS